MKSNRVFWGIIAILVLITIAVTFGTKSSFSQKETPKEQKESPFGDLSKYPTVEYDAPEPMNYAQREEREIKNKRYDEGLTVSKNPHSRTDSEIAFDVESLPPVIPFAESRLIVIGEILNSKALLSNEKKGIYSEYSVRI